MGVFDMEHFDIQLFFMALLLFRTCRSKKRVSAASWSLLTEKISHIDLNVRCAYEKWSANIILVIFWKFCSQLSRFTNKSWACLGVFPYTSSPADPIVCAREIYTMKQIVPWTKSKYLTNPRNSYSINLNSS